jgi:hypothetical protein
VRENDAAGQKEPDYTHELIPEPSPFLLSANAFGLSIIA